MYKMLLCTIYVPDMESALLLPYITAETHGRRNRES